MHAIEVEVDRSLLLNANQRLHYAPKARITQALRKLGTEKAQGLPSFDRTHLTVRIHWPDKRHRDAHNIYPTLKALIDGFVDAGVIPDDNDDYLVGPDLRRADTRSGVKGLTRFVFEFRDPE